MLRAFARTRAARRTSHPSLPPPGGNLAGIATAHELEKTGCAVTLLDPRDFGWIPFAAFRAATAPDGAAWAARMTVPRDRALKRTAFVRGTATGVDTAAKTVTYAPAGGGAPAALPYDFLVLATGASYPAPFAPVGETAAEARAALAALRATVAGARSVVVVGGGPSGVELAGELRDALPAAAVRLVHAGAALLSGAGNHAPPPALSAKLVERLAASRIDVSLGARVASVAGGAPHAAAGPAVLVGPLAATLEGAGGARVLEGVDVLFYATGARPNTDFLKGGQLAAALAPGGGVTAGPTYAVPGFAGVFALGDCAANADAKAGWLLESAAKIVAANVAATVRGKALREAPKGGFSGILAVPIGKNNGAGLLPFGVVGPFLIKNIKGGDLFVGKVGGEWGYSAKELIKLAA